MDQALAKRIEAMLLEDFRLDRVHLRRYHEYSDREIIRPGFTRLNLPYFMDDECVDFVLSAVAMVAEHGWKLLPQVIFSLWTKKYKLFHLISVCVVCFLHKFTSCHNFQTKLSYLMQPSMFALNPPS